MTIILVGPSGSSKSTTANLIAKEILSRNQSVCICSTDNYFIESEKIYGNTGIYKFDINKLGMAHVWNFYTFTKALQNGTDVIIVDNTNLRRSYITRYAKKAIEFGYDYIIKLIGQELWSSPLELLRRQKHEVPLTTIVKQCELARNVLQFIGPDGKLLPL